MLSRQLARRKLNALDFAASDGLVNQCANGIFLGTGRLFSSSSSSSSSSPQKASSTQSKKVSKTNSTSGANFSTSSHLAAPALSNTKRVLGEVRNDWTKAEIREMYSRPLLELVYDAATIHRMHHDPKQVQQCTLLSIKTGGCPETCNSVSYTHLTLPTKA